MRGGRKKRKRERGKDGVGEERERERTYAKHFQFHLMYLHQDSVPAVM